MSNLELIFWIGQTAGILFIISFFIIYFDKNLNNIIKMYYELVYSFENRNKIKMISILIILFISIVFLLRYINI